MKYDPHLQLKRFLQGQPQDSDDARQNLLAMGERAAPYVMEALESKKSEERYYLRSDSEALRLSELLVEFGDPRTLVPLLQMGYVANNPYRSGLFLKVVHVLEQRAEEGDMLALLNLLRFSQPQWKQGALLITMTSSDRVAVARALVVIAERDPHPELRDVLPLLRYQLTVPLEFIGLHRRLKAALASESLPIPVEAAPRAVESLPIPVERPDDRV